ncbi:MAG: neutral/alkaline non-lysosomal ceramidase N-terminal domain-containing protein [Planctomycetota bacterium]
MRVSLIVFMVANVLSVFAAADQPVFRAGAAKTDITPPKGVSLDGTISKNGPVRGIHDPLASRALVLDDGQRQMAIVVNDACMIGQPVYDKAKSLARRNTGIPAECMLMSATHSHAAVRAIHIGTEPVDDTYHETLAQQMAAAVTRAHQRLAPAKIGFASLEKPDLFACRRFLCEPGTVSANPFGETDERVKSVAGGSTGVIRPAGPIDPQLSIVSVRHADDTPLAVLANYSPHYCGGYRRGWVSADYFGTFARRVEKKLAMDTPHPPPVAMMSNGTSGDAGATKLKGQFAPFERLEKVGQRLADDVLNAIDQMEHDVPEHLATSQSEIELGVRLPDEARMAWAKSVLANPEAKKPHRWTPIFAREALELSEYPPRYEIVLQAIRIGDIRIAAIPCEVFGETGLAIKQRSPAPRTFVMELANGYSGYLPTPEQHRWGGYETWPARSSHLEVDAEPKIRAEALRLLQQLEVQ